MILGERQNLIATRATVNGMYFADREKQEVLLPKREVPSDLNIGDIKELFIYKDSEDRLIGTLDTPLIQMGELKKLRVIKVTKIGAFLDWGLPKDLFLPFKEQTEMINSNMSYLVALYVDKTNRLCATMKVYKYLKINKDYKIGQVVEGTVYKKDNNIGALVALEDKYFGFIPKDFIVGRIEVGDTIKARIVYIREDGKVNISMRKPIAMKIDEDSKKILALIKEWDNDFIITEKDDPEKIKRICNMSKSDFKRAVGRLLKENKIFIDDNKKIRLNK